MRRNPWLVFGVLLILLLFAVGVFVGGAGFLGRTKKLNASGAVLVLDVDGVIMDSERFVKTLKKYRDDERVRAVLVRVNSPGGAVGPSQEIYSELLRTRREFKKPVVVACTSVAASGAYYIAAAADKIFTNPGTLMGSIGVIMEFANLENLYSWAKVKRYALTTGPYKDSGAEYREMRPDERQLFMTMLSEVHMQFKQAVAEGRKLELAQVEKYADGRVFTGATAVKLGFADELGTTEDALHEAGRLGGITGEPETFEPPKKRASLWQLLMSDDDDDATFKPHLPDLLRVKLIGKPLFLMPGTLVDET
jgi:protease-4